MSPILQSRANASAYGYRSFVTAAATSFESIATVTVGSGGAANVEFTSIPSTYSHLQVRYIGRSTFTGSDYTQNLDIQFNNDTSSNYSNHDLIGFTGGYTAVLARAETSQTRIRTTSGLANGTWGSSVFGGGILDILDYQNTNKYKTVRSLAGAEGNSSTLISAASLSSGLWMSTSAISSIKIITYNGNLAQYSTFALYGIKSA
jgi:hypothetical protein